MHTIAVSVHGALNTHSSIPQRISALADRIAEIAITFFYNLFETLLQTLDALKNWMGRIQNRPAPHVRRLALPPATPPRVRVIRINGKTPPPARSSPANLALSNESDSDDSDHRPRRTRRDRTPPAILDVDPTLVPTPPLSAAALAAQCVHSTEPPLYPNPVNYTLAVPPTLEALATPAAPPSALQLVANSLREIRWREPSVPRNLPSQFFSDLPPVIRARLLRAAFPLFLTLNFSRRPTYPALKDIPPQSLASATTPREPLATPTALALRSSSAPVSGNSSKLSWPVFRNQFADDPFRELRWHAPSVTRTLVVPLSPLLPPNIQTRVQRVLASPYLAERQVLALLNGILSIHPNPLPNADNFLTTTRTSFLPAPETTTTSDAFSESSTDSDSDSGDSDHIIPPPPLSVAALAAQSVHSTEPPLYPDPVNYTSAIPPPVQTPRPLGIVLPVPIVPSGTVAQLTRRFETPPPSVVGARSVLPPPTRSIAAQIRRDEKSRVPTGVTTSDPPISFEQWLAQCAREPAWLRESAHASGQTVLQKAEALKRLLAPFASLPEPAVPRPAPLPEVVAATPPPESPPVLVAAVQNPVSSSAPVVPPPAPLPEVVAATPPPESPPALVAAVQNPVSSSAPVVPPPAPLPVAVFNDTHAHEATRSSYFNPWGWAHSAVLCGQETLSRVASKAHQVYSTAQDGVSGAVENTRAMAQSVRDAYGWTKEVGSEIAAEFGWVEEDDNEIDMDEMDDTDDGDRSHLPLTTTRRAARAVTGILRNPTWKGVARAVVGAFEGSQLPGTAMISVAELDHLETFYTTTRQFQGTLTKLKSGWDVINAAQYLKMLPLYLLPSVATKVSAVVTFPVSLAYDAVLEPVFLGQDTRRIAPFAALIARGSRKAKSITWISGETRAVLGVLEGQTRQLQTHLETMGSFAARAHSLPDAIEKMMGPRDKASIIARNMICSSGIAQMYNPLRQRAPTLEFLGKVKELIAPLAPILPPLRTADRPVDRKRQVAAATGHLLALGAEISNKARTHKTPSLEIVQDMALLEAHDTVMRALSRYAVRPAVNLIGTVAINTVSARVFGAFITPETSPEGVIPYFAQRGIFRGATEAIMHYPNRIITQVAASTIGLVLSPIGVALNAAVRPAVEAGFTYPCQVLTYRSVSSHLEDRSGVCARSADRFMEMDQDTWISIAYWSILAFTTLHMLNALYRGYNQGYRLIEQANALGTRVSEVAASAKASASPAPSARRDDAIS